MIAIRRATAADAAGIARVHCQSHSETYRPIFGSNYTGPSEAQRTAHWQKCLELGEVAFVAIADEDIIGFTHAAADQAGGVAMTTLYLLAPWQRRGIGRDLMTTLLGHLHRQGHVEATFDCLLRNANAVAFYKSQGARETGRQDSGPREEIRFVIPTRPMA